MKRHGVLICVHTELLAAHQAGHHWAVPTQRRVFLFDKGAMSANSSSANQWGLKHIQKHGTVSHHVSFFFLELLESLGRALLNLLPPL